MKKSVFVLIAAIALSSMSFVLSPMWVTHHDVLKFDIDFPSTPTRTVMTVAAPITNRVQLEQIVAGFPHFILVYEDKAGAYVNVNKVCNDKVDAHAAFIGGAVVRRDAPIAWKLGTQVTAKIETAGGIKCDIRVYVQGNKSAMMIIEQNGVYAAPKDVNKFWESLKM